MTIARDTTLPADPPSPADPSGLAEAEQLLVRSWRRIATGRLWCPQTLRDFGDAFGGDAGPALSALWSFMKALDGGTRRVLAIGAPGSPKITADERQMLTVIAAAQADESGLVEANLCWLSRPGPRDALRRAVATLAVVLARHDQRLTRPDCVSPSRGGAGPHALRRDAYAWKADAP